jgi:hypothetical protein
MMKIAKTLDEFPEFVKIRDAVQALQSEKSEVSSRLERIALELSQPREQQIDGQSAWNLVLEGEGTVRSRYATDNRSELRDEQIQLEGRLTFIHQALEVGTMELDKARGQASLEICATVRPEWVAQIKIILECLKQISAANVSLDVMRATLERDGVVTGALPYSKFDIGGSWSDPYGGRVTGYQREAADHFPELAAAAGMAIKSKLKALIDRERAFDNQGVTE